MGGDPRGPYTGRYVVTSPRKLLRTRRGGGRVVWGGDACVALAGGEKRTGAGRGRRKRPPPTPHHSRPYECDDLPPKKPPRESPRGRPRCPLVPHAGAMRATPEGKMSEPPLYRSRSITGRTRCDGLTWL